MPDAKLRWEFVFGTITMIVRHYRPIPMNELIKHLARVIAAATRRPGGMAALSIVLLVFLATQFIRSVSEPVQVIIFILLWGSATGFGFAMLNAGKPHRPTTAEHNGSKREKHNQPGPRIISLRGALISIASLAIAAIASRALQNEEPEDPQGLTVEQFIWRKRSVDEATRLEVAMMVWNRTEQAITLTRPFLIHLVRKGEIWRDAPWSMEEPLAPRRCSIYRGELADVPPDVSYVELRPPWPKDDRPRIDAVMKQLGGCNRPLTFDSPTGSGLIP